MIPDPAPAPPRWRPRDVAAALLAALLTVVLAGCGVRLETAIPEEPVPDAVEQVRRAAVADALGVAELAQTAQDADGLPEAATVELTRIAADAHRHVEELGGVYDSGLDADDEHAEESPAPDPSPPADAAAVVIALSDSAGRNRTAANTTADGALARLLASIGAAQTVSASRLAALTDVPGPEPVAPVIPTPQEAAQEEAEEQDDAEAEPTAVATTTPGETLQPPSGLTADDYRAIVLAEDGARYALEVRAAQTSGDERAALLTRSDVHGERAQAWAALGSIADTAQDPRLVAYAIPRADDDATLVRALQTGLATDYASLVGTTAPTTRGLLIDLLIEVSLTLDTWGATPTAFPGLPEQQAE